MLRFQSICAGLLLLASACASTPATTADKPEVAKKAQAPALMDAQLVEDAGDGWQRLRCSGLGADVKAAVLHARHGCLYWLASHRLTTTADESSKLQVKRHELLARVDALVRQPPVMGRKSPHGIMSQVRNPDGVRVKLMADVNEAGTRRLLEEWGVLDKLALPDGRKLTIVLLPGSPATARKMPLIRALVFSRLEHLPLAWLDLSSGAAADHASNLKIAQEASADLLLEATYEEKKKGEAISCAFTLQLTNTRDKTTAATAVTQSRDYYAGRPGSGNRALQEAVNDASAKISPQFPRAIRAFAAP